MNRYFYETHSHTKEASACGVWSIEEAIKCHKDFGYTGMILTNHFYYGNTCVDRKLPWSEWVRRFCEPYNRGLEYAKKLDFQLMFGWESCYDGTEFLIYGLDENWLTEHPQIRDASIPEQYELVHGSGGIVIHPHPFRVEDYIPEIRLFPDDVDGIELYNACHNSPLGSAHFQADADPQAKEYAAAHPRFVFTAGSDAHHPPIYGGGMVFDHKLADIHEFCKLVLKKDYVELLDGSLGADHFE